MSGKSAGFEHRFVAYGCSIDSDVDLSPWLCRGSEGRLKLRVAQSREIADPLAQFKSYPLFTSHGRDVTLYTDRELADGVPGQPWRFEVGGVAVFDWTGGGTEISYRRLEDSSDTLLAFWLIHIFLPLFLTLENIYEFIHACAVDVEGETVLFVAPSHGGKSTLTDYFLKQGHGLVSDDKVATYFEDDKFWAVPSHPNHRPYRQLEDLGLRVGEFTTYPRAVDAVYSLVRSDPGADAMIRPLGGHEKFVGMLPSYLFSFSHLNARRLNYLGRWSNVVPLYAVDVPWDLDRLDEVYRAIRGHRGP